MKNMKKIISIAFIAIGFIAIIVGFIMLAKDSGISGSTASFGADFYTYVNRNAATAASNTQKTAEILKTGFGWLFILGGALTAVIGLSKFFATIENKPKNNAESAQIDQPENNTDSLEKKDELSDN